MKTWLKDNALNLIVTAAAIILAFASLSARVNILEAKTKDFPSKDYFELKFQTIDEKLTEVKTKIENHLGEGK